jgi:hypothetical protein
MGCFLDVGSKFSFVGYFLSAQMIDRELERNLYVLISLFLFFLEREIIVDIMFLFIALCF